jgi:hypothetical protein
MGAVNIVFWDIFKVDKKRIAMENLPAFLAGTLIFMTYMFFLLRMIYRQHEIQEKNEIKIVHISKKIQNKEKIAS